MKSSEWHDTRLDWNTLPQHPMQLFGAWYEAARDVEPWQAGAMLLSTANLAGEPSARVVLMRGFDEQGVRFFTNYESRKGQQLSENPKFAATFWWPSQVRQVRMEGRAERLPRAASEEYFAGRPRGSQIGAWSSPQSQPIRGLDALHSNYDRVAGDFEGKDVTCPPFWGGYYLKPHRVEFWQGGKDRLHDRVAYTMGKTGWVYERLAP